MVITIQPARVSSAKAVGLQLRGSDRPGKAWLTLAQQKKTQTLAMMQLCETMPCEFESCCLPQRHCTDFFADSWASFSMPAHP